MPFCNICRAEIPEEAAFCGQCGAALPRFASPASLIATSAQISKRSPFRYVLWIGAGFFAIIVVLGLLIAAGSKGTAGISDARAIQAVTRQDAELAGEMNAAIQNVTVNNDDGLDKVGGFIKDYVAAARQIDTRSCPRDFAEAYFRNLAAWADEADQVLAHPHIPQTQTEAFVDGFFRGLAGDVSGGTEEINAWYGVLKAKNAEVKRTQAEVDALAVRYGAR
jgi:hypothetical protein